MIEIIRISNSEYSFAKTDKRGMRHIAEALSFPNPNPFVGGRNIRMFDERNKTFKIGMWLTLKNYLKANGVEYVIRDYEYKLPDDVVIDDRMTGKYIHQRLAVEHFYKRRFGIIVVPTRGGKTFIASEIARIFLNTDTGNFLFCVDNTTLFRQAVGDFKAFFERYGGIEVGEIRAGKVETDKRITVAMIQTMQSVLSERCKDRKKKTALKKYLTDLKFLAVDEIHDNCSNSKLKLYKKCRNIEYQLCLSATPYRSNEFMQNLKLRAWSGDVVYTIKEETLRERKVLSDYKVFELLIDHNDIEYPEVTEDTDYAELRKQLIFQSDVRNKYLMRVIDMVKRLRLKTLVLFQSVDHGDFISRISGHPFISGRNKDKEREVEKMRFLNVKDGGILLASEIFKKGVTLPEAQVIINVDSGYEASNVIQRKGRVLGTTATKDRSLIIDFIDVYDDYFSKHSEARLETYINDIGEEKVGILDTSAQDCFETLERWTKKWFRIEA